MLVAEPNGMTEDDIEAIECLGRFATDDLVIELRRRYPVGGGIVLVGEDLAVRHGKTWGGVRGIYGAADASRTARARDAFRAALRGETLSPRYSSRRTGGGPRKVVEV